MVWRHLWRSAAVVAVVLVVDAVPGSAQRLTWLGVPSGAFTSDAVAVSVDGRVVVGGSPTEMHAYRWRADSGWQDLGIPPAGYRAPIAVGGMSADGRVVVGWVKDSNLTTHAFRWVEGSGIQFLGDLGCGWSEAYAVSADGRVIVGRTGARIIKPIPGGVDTLCVIRAFRWMGGRMEDLDTLPGYPDASTAQYIAGDVSADGSVVGTAEDLVRPQERIVVRAFRWVAGQGMHELGMLPGYSWSEAYLVSSDGRIIYGVARDTSSGSVRIVRWVDGQVQQIQDLSDSLVPNGGIMQDVSADGRIVVGYTYGRTGRYAFRWVEGQGMENLNITYASLLTDGSVLLGATAISPDGRFIVGRGYNASSGRHEAFLLDVCPGGDSDSDYICDDWERNGIDINNDGTVDLDLPRLGARVGVRDIFVEYDAMQGFAPSQAAINAVVGAFANAPGNPPFALHVQNGGDLSVPTATWNDPPWGDLDGFKRQFFGTPAERNSPNWQNIRRARQEVFRYCVFAQQYDTAGSSGIGELPGNDFAVTLGHPGWVQWQNTLQQQLQPLPQLTWDNVVAGTFMHELGHTLGLRHGGDTHTQYKPNYHSVMNYLWQTPQPAYAGSWVLDYSRGVFNTLNETNLSEPVGIGGGGVHAGHSVPLRGVRNAAGNPVFVLEVGPADFDGDGNATGVGVVQDLNGDSRRRVLGGYDDWANVDLSHGPNWTDGVHIILRRTSPREDKELQELKPPPQVQSVQEDTTELEEELQELTYEIYQELSSTNMPPDTVEVLEPGDGAVVTTAHPQFVLRAQDAEGDTLRFLISLRRAGDTTAMRQWWTGFVSAGASASFTVPDTLALTDGEWRYMVLAMDWKTGMSWWNTPRRLVVQTTGVEETFGPRAVLLAQNVPNPFATSTTIRFVLPQWSHVKLTVVDVLGREVATLVDGELRAGEHTVVFSAGDLPSGVYFYRMQAGAVVQLRKMEVVR